MYPLISLISLSVSVVSCHNICQLLFVIPLVYQWSPIIVVIALLLPLVDISMYSLLSIKVRMKAIGNNTSKSPQHQKKKTFVEVSTNNTTSHLENYRNEEVRRSKPDVQK